MSTQVYLGIGSNLNRDNAILFAIARLRPLFANFKVSPVYESKPVRTAEPDYYNLVVGGQTELGFSELYKVLKEIEAEAGSEFMIYNTTNFGLKPRVDIDILIYGEEVHTEPCKVPRHDVQDYPFVTTPLNDIAPDLVHPILKFTVAEIFEQMQPHIPEERRVHQVDFDFNRPVPAWPEPATETPAEVEPSKACSACSGAYNKEQPEAEPFASTGDAGCNWC